VNLESEECHAILRISSSWSLGSLYDAAVSRLDVLVAANHARRIEIGHMFQLKHWVDQGLGELCVRDDAPSLAEEPRLEKSDLRFLARVRSMAVTGTRDDAGFHRMFPDIPQWERLLNCKLGIRGHRRLLSHVAGYRCAYQGRILLQGFVYFTKRHLCFYSSVFGTTVSFTILFMFSTLTSSANFHSSYRHHESRETIYREDLSKRHCCRSYGRDLLVFESHDPRQDLQIARGASQLRLAPAVLSRATTVLISVVL
jgi:hypothetical protein